MRRGSNTPADTNIVSFLRSDRFLTASRNMLARAYIGLRGKLPRVRTGIVKSCTERKDLPKKSAPRTNENSRANLFASVPDVINRTNFWLTSRDQKRSRKLR